MAIYQPDLILSKADREALMLLGQLALSTHSQQTNLAPDQVPLSVGEAARLLELLEEFVSSRRFQEGAFFSEGLANGNGLTDAHLKEIYLSWRQRTGRTRVASTHTWNEFVLRSGLGFSENAWIWPRSGWSPVRPMNLDHFLAMERKLVDAVGLHPRVRDLILTFVEDGLAQLEQIRERKARVKPGAIKSFVKSFIDELAPKGKIADPAPMTRRKIIALSTIFMDTAALFVTRDWTATGVLSTLASMAPDALEYGPDR